MTETKSFRDELEPEFARLLSFGISYSDLMEVLEHVEGELSWAIGMEVRGERYLRAAEAAWAENHPTSAAEHWRRATDCFFHAQLPLSCDPGFKQVLQQRSRHTYRRLAPLLAPAALPVAVPLTDDVALPGYLRTPRGGAPCVLLLNDLESSKEVELHYLAEGFLRRGLGTLTLDAPGQGELSGAGSILDFDAALPRMVDFLSERTHSCVGVFGIGLGGYLACRAAALEPRIAAAACVSGFYDGRGVARFSSRARKALRRCCDAPEDVPWEDLAGMLSLEPLWGRLDRPLLIVHRRNDPVVDLRQVEALRAWASGNTQVWIVDQADNACTPRLTECLPVIGDWMCNHLRTSQAATAMMEIKSIVA